MLNPLKQPASIPLKDLHSAIAIRAPVWGRSQRLSTVEKTDRKMKANLIRARFSPRKSKD